MLIPVIFLKQYNTFQREVINRCTSYTVAPYYVFVVEILHDDITIIVGFFFSLNVYATFPH